MRLTIIDEGIVWKNQYPTVRSLVALKGYGISLGSGRVLMSLQIGQARQSRDLRCILLLSEDYGRTWTETAPIIPEAERDPNYAYGRALLSKASDGSFWAASCRMVIAEPEDPRFSKQNGGWIGGDNFICRSTNNGRTWSKPHFVAPEPPEGGFPVLSSPVHELASGELMLVFEPFYTTTLSEMEHEVSCLYSQDGGLTWDGKNVIAQDQSGTLVYFDPRMARLADGTWVSVFWTHNKRTDESLNTSIAFSDDGHVWTPPAATPLWGCLTLPLALPDGRLLVVYNHRRSPPGMRTAISEDGGHTWDMDSEYVLWDGIAKRIIGERVTESYARAWNGGSMEEMFTWDFMTPYPILLDDGSILVTFTATQMDHIMHQRYVRFNIE